MHASITTGRSPPPPHPPVHCGGVRLAGRGVRKVSAVTARSVSGPAKGGGWDTVAGFICPSHGSGGGGVRVEGEGWMGGGGLVEGV